MVITKKKNLYAEHIEIATYQLSSANLVSRAVTRLNDSHSVPRVDGINGESVCIILKV